ncbi:response regulator [Deferribacter autotrophicus]|uniref:Response regulator n=1 Tax=Deferribacter autotrophicus TaxID=500465 RepID=A0A5A8EZH3_9BACT|nr:response regulator [Deferribacter autotrophicus]KAA0257080.1 response regulator [Deferribacter autotrophicus]
MTTILIVDDSLFVQESLKEELFKIDKDLVVLCAKNPVEAEKILKEYIIDLMLLDVKMPIKSGNIFLKEIRSLSYYSDLPIVMLTSITEKALILELAKLGIDGYVVKNNLANIRDKIEKFIKNPSEINRLKQFSRVSEFISLKDRWFQQLFDLLYDGDYSSLDMDVLEELNRGLKVVNKSYKLSNLENDLRIRILAGAIFLKKQKPIFVWQEYSFIEKLKEKVIGLLLGFYLYVILKGIYETEMYSLIITYILNLFIIGEYCGRLKYDVEILSQLIKKQFLLFYKMFLQNCPIKMPNFFEDLQRKSVKEILFMIEDVSSNLFPDNPFELSVEKGFNNKFEEMHQIILKEIYKNI